MTYPSEQTIVVNSNHFLLNEIGSPKGWIICCTTNQEAALGWDASLEGFKDLYVQYKGIAYAYVGSADVRVNISPGQRGVLNAFAAAHGAPAYYGVCDYQTYGAIGGDFFLAPPAVFFHHCAYVNEKDLPIGTTYLRGNNGAGWQAHGVGGVPLGGVPFLDGPAFAQEVRICNIGSPIRRYRLINDAPQLDDGDQAEAPGALRIARVIAPTIQ